MYEKLIESWIDADNSRKECCVEVIECDMCELCPLNTINKCVWFQEIGDNDLTKKYYMAWLEFVDAIEEMGKDYQPVDREELTYEDTW